MKRIRLALPSHVRRSALPPMVVTLLLWAVLSSPGGAAGTGNTLAPVLHASTWLNGRPTTASLRGKVVLVDVFTVDCINCQNVTPNLRKLHAREGNRLAIVGVHTPETMVERDRSHVKQSLHDLGIVWPVAIDDDSRIWNAYSVQAWPTQLIFDRSGRLRQTIVGDSQDDAVDAAIDKLLAEPAS
jgi:thiol-disulfide isomerase/thioredoxin